MLKEEIDILELSQRNFTRTTDAEQALVSRGYHLIQPNLYRKGVKRAATVKIKDKTQWMILTWEIK